MSIEKGFTNGFISQSTAHHKAMASQHEELSEHYQKLADHHEGENSVTAKCFAKCAACHERIAKVHTDRAEAYAVAASGLDENSRSMLHQQAHGAANLRNVRDEVDPELADLVS